MSWIVHDQSRRIKGISPCNAKREFPGASAYTKEDMSSSEDDNMHQNDVDSSQDMAEIIDYSTGEKKSLTDFFDLSDLKFYLHPSPDHVAKHPKFKNKFKYYAVANGNVLGIFSNYDQCSLSVQNVKDHVYKGFQELEQAKSWLQEICINNPQCALSRYIKQVDEIVKQASPKVDDNQPTIKSSSLKKRKLEESSMQIEKPSIESKKILSESELLDALKAYNDAKDKSILSREIRLQAFAMDEKNRHEETLKLQLNNGLGANPIWHMTLNGTEIKSQYDLMKFIYSLPKGSTISGQFNGFSPNKDLEPQSNPNVQHNIKSIKK